MRQGLLILATFFISVLSHAQGWGEIQKLVDDDPFNADRFGYAVAMDGEYAVVGVKDDDVGSTDTGSIFIFKIDGSGNWVQHQKFISPDWNQFDSFGSDVSISGNYLIVGAIGEDYDEIGGLFLSAAGAAYIYEKDVSDNWLFVNKVVAPDRAAGDVFGFGVAIDGNYAVVTAPREDEDEIGNNTLSNAGSAYIYERDTNGNWNFAQKIVASDRAIEDRFGNEGSVAISGNTIIVGVTFQDGDASGGNPLTSAGAIYVFERDTNGTWSQTQKLVASNADRVVSLNFGRSVAIDNDILLAGARGANSSTGATYIFERDGTGTWNEIQKITASDGSTGDYFGVSVDLEGNNAIVGAQFNDQDTAQNDDVGAAYVFEKDTGGTWNQVQKLVAADWAPGDRFGFSVGISGNNALVGAYLKDGDTFGEVGAVYIFDRDEPTLSNPEVVLKNTVSYFPNPVKDQLSIDLDSIHQSLKLTVINSLGQEVLNKAYDSTSSITLDFPYKNGFYVIAIQTSDGYATAFKIIKN